MVLNYEHLPHSRAMQKEIAMLRTYLRTDFEEVIKLCAEAKLRYRPSFRDLSHLESAISMLSEAYNHESKGNMFAASVAFSATARFVRSTGEAENGNNMQFVRELQESADTCMEKYRSSLPSYAPGPEALHLMAEFNLGKELPKPRD